MRKNCKKILKPNDLNYILSPRKFSQGNFFRENLTNSKTLLTFFDKNQNNREPTKILDYFEIGLKLELLEWQILAELGFELVDDTNQVICC